MALAHGVHRADRAPGSRAAASRAANCCSASRCCRAWRWWSAACRRGMRIGHRGRRGLGVVRRAVRFAQQAPGRACRSADRDRAGTRRRHPRPDRCCAADAAARARLRRPLVRCCPALHDALLLLALRSRCTLLPFTLSLVALRHMSAFAAQLAVNLEPVYAIVLAIAAAGRTARAHADRSTPAWRSSSARCCIYPLWRVHSRCAHPEVLAYGRSQGRRRLMRRARGTSWQARPPHRRPAHVPRALRPQGAAVLDHAGSALRVPQRAPPGRARAPAVRHRPGRRRRLRAAHRRSRHRQDHAVPAAAGAAARRTRASRWCSIRG